MLAQDLRQMLAKALRIGHARCVVLFTIERHTDTLSSGWFHGSDSPYSAVCSIHSIGLEVESSYCLHRFSTNHEIRWNQENRMLRIHHTQLRINTLIPQIAANSCGRATRASADHNPLRDGC